MSGRDKGQYQVVGLGAGAQGSIYLHILHKGRRPQLCSSLWASSPPLSVTLHLDLIRPAILAAPPAAALLPPQQGQKEAQQHHHAHHQSEHQADLPGHPATAAPAPA